MKKNKVFKVEDRGMFPKGSEDKRGGAGKENEERDHPGQKQMLGGFKVMKVRYDWRSIEGMTGQEERDASERAGVGDS